MTPSADRRDVDPRRARPCRSVARTTSRSAFSPSTRGRRSALGDETLAAVEGLALRAAPAIENARRYREARQLADTDALTGLHNRRMFHETLAREVARAQRYSRTLGAARPRPRRLQAGQRPLRPSRRRRCARRGRRADARRRTHGRRPLPDRRRGVRRDPARVGAGRTPRRSTSGSPRRSRPARSPMSARSASLPVSPSCAPTTTRSASSSEPTARSTRPSAKARTAPSGRLTWGTHGSPRAPSSLCLHVRLTGLRGAARMPTWRPSVDHESCSRSGRVRRPGGPHGMQHLRTATRTLPTAAGVHGRADARRQRIRAALPRAGRRPGRRRLLPRLRATVDHPVAPRRGRRCGGTRHSARALAPRSREVSSKTASPIPRDPAASISGSASHSPRTGRCEAALASERLRHPRPRRASIRRDRRPCPT